MYYEKFLETVNKFEEDYELGELLYFEAIKRLREVQENLNELDDIKHLERIVKVFLMSWGMMGRVVARKDFDWQKLGNSLRNLEPKFSLLRGKKFLTVNFSDELISDSIKTIYESLGRIKLVGPTTRSKILHLLNPEIFVMWDNSIVDKHHKINREINYSSNGYLEFLKISQKAMIGTLSKLERETEKSSETIEQELREKCQNKTIAKIIDEYNWMDVE